MEQRATIFVEAMIVIAVIGVLAFLIGLLVCLLLALGSLFLLFALRDRSQLEDCFMQGRTNCVPLDPAPAGK